MNILSMSSVARVDAQVNIRYNVIQGYITVMLLAYFVGLFLMRSGVRYGGWRWRIVAGYVRHRDNFKCVKCGNRGWVVHHKHWLKHGGWNWPFNLVTLCESCHKKEHPWLA